MKQVRDLRSDGFDIDALDNDLRCMALLCALPEEYRTFVSSLTVVSSDLSFESLRQAFRQEELNRTSGSLGPSHANSARALALAQVICDFCL